MYQKCGSDLHISRLAVRITLCAPAVVPSFVAVFWDFTSEPLAHVRHAPVEAVHRSEIGQYAEKSVARLAV